MVQEKRSSTISRAAPILLAFVIFAVAVGLFFAKAIVLSALFGIGLGTLISPVVTTMHRKFKIPRSLGAGIAGLLLFSAMAGFFYLIGDLISDRMVPLLERLPQAFEELKTLTSRFFGESSFLERAIQRTNLANVARQALTGIGQSIQLTLVAVAMFVFVVALAGYLSVNPGRYVRSFLSAFPAYLRPRIEELLCKSAVELRHWFLAQLVGMFVVGMLTAFGLWLIGVEQWLLIGFLTAIAEFIPYLGPILAGFLAVLVTLASDPGSILLVIGLFILIQQLENNLITPIVLKKGIELPPVHLLVMALILGTWFGFLGVFLAAPLFAVLRVIYLETYVVKMNQLTRKSSPH